MSDISALGLGLMGSALARSLVSGGHGVTVWNRDRPPRISSRSSTWARQPSCHRRGGGRGQPGRARLHRRLRVDPIPARGCGRRREAVGPPWSCSWSTGGTPQEAREFEATGSRQRGPTISTGHSCGYPEDVGTPSATIVYSGRRPVFDRCERSAHITWRGHSLRRGERRSGLGGDARPGLALLALRRVRGRGPRHRAVRIERRRPGPLCSRSA